MQKCTRTAASLVRSSAARVHANQLHSFEDPNLTNLVDTDVHPDTLPTPEQKVALEELLIFEEEKILAWLTILRSLQPGFQYRAGRGCLSSQQLNALSTLKDCNDNDILTWLNLSLVASEC